MTTLADLGGQRLLADAQFNALAKLLRLRQGAATEAARLVLVKGIKQSMAAAETGLTRQGVSSAVKRVRDGLALAKIATEE